MKKSKYWEEHIATALRHVKAEAPIAQVTRKLGSARRRTIGDGRSTPDGGDRDSSTEAVGGGKSENEATAGRSVAGQSDVP